MSYVACGFDVLLAADHFDPSGVEMIQLSSELVHLHLVFAAAAFDIVAVHFGGSAFEAHVVVVDNIDCFVALPYF